MARTGWGRHVKVVDLAAFPDDNSYQVGTNEWNADLSPIGVLGFTKVAATISGGAIVPTGSLLEIQANATLNTITVGADVNEFDLIYLIALAGQSSIVINDQTDGGAGKIRLLAGENTTSLSQTVPMILMCRTISGVKEWIEYGGGTANNLTLANFDATKIITQTEGIANNDNETTLPTSAAVKDFVDAQITAEDLDATTDSGTIDIDLSSETLSVVGGEGIDTSATGTTITVAGEDATTSNKGIASFASAEFTLSSGAVAINAIAEAKVTGLTTALGTKAPLASPTFTGTLVAATLDISGDVDVDGTLETDVLTIDGTALAEYISDTVGNMVTSNTETGIAVTYEDGDNTLDFVVGTLNQNTTGTAAGLSTALISSSGGTGLTSFTAGDILYYVSGTTLTKLPKPSTPAGEVLTFATSATAPSWAAAGGGEILHDFTDFDLKDSTAIANHVSGGSDAPITGTDAYTYVRAIDGYNDGFFIKIKKNNGTFTEVQIA